LISERVNFYLGDCSSLTSINQTIFKLEFSELYLRDNNIYYNLNKLTSDKNRALKVYFHPLKKLVDSLGFKDKIICVKSGDIYFNDPSEYALSKTRSISNNNTYSILKCFAYERHWSKTRDALTDKILFKDKKNRAVWRGATNGFIEMDDDGYVIKNRRSNRFLIVEKYLNSNLADIGLSKINLDTLLFRYQSALKETMTIQQMRQYKYIISLEGNDKDSGLNWKLKSNSVVFMCKPIINSWLMEEKLQPNIHYIEIKDDLSDLEEKINWCNNHPAICCDIIYNANQYMAQFDDSYTENTIESEVLKNFLAKINIIEN
jgi:hypothetical protein